MSTVESPVRKVSSPKKSGATAHPRTFTTQNKQEKKALMAVDKGLRQEDDEEQDQGSSDDEVVLLKKRKRTTSKADRQIQPKEKRTVQSASKRKVNASKEEDGDDSDNDDNDDDDDDDDDFHALVKKKKEIEAKMSKGNAKSPPKKKESAIIKKPNGNAKSAPTAKKGKTSAKARIDLGIKKKTIAKSKAHATKAKIKKQLKDDANDMIDVKGGNEIKWTTLEHQGVLFPPEYEPHRIPLLYAGTKLILSPICEEAATFYAAKLETEYVEKEVFRRNFFKDFQDLLKRYDPKNHAIIKNLDECNFGEIFAMLEEKKNAKKNIPPAQKKAAKLAEQEAIKKHTIAIVDGREEKVGNFRVEPPGLFMGRGAHPLMGKIKKRIQPEDITINIGPDAPVPPCPVQGHQWGRIVHQRNVTWLAYWKDSITRGFKYVWLSAASAFKSSSDLEKFDKARKLGKIIDKIRDDYRAGWAKKDHATQQRSVVMYLIDKLALRVGNEKGEDQADTVGCCSLRVEHISFEEPCTIELDFLGKDSIRYQNSVPVEKQVFELLKSFCTKKSSSDSIFDLVSVTALNLYLKELMDGLTAKVFRTFNASYTLDLLLRDTDPKLSVQDKVNFYKKQNKEVAILCNHQRTIPKTHGAQMDKLKERTDDLIKYQGDLKKALVKLKKENLSDIAVVEYVQPKPELTSEMTQAERMKEKERAAALPKIKVERKMKEESLKKNIERVKLRLEKLKADAEVKEDLKTVALGTSKQNYLDPRITVAWCKKFEVPIEKMFPKLLLTKFTWAMDCSEDFVF